MSDRDVAEHWRDQMLSAASESADAAERDEWLACAALQDATIASIFTRYEPELLTSDLILAIAAASAPARRRGAGKRTVALRSAILSVLEYIDGNLSSRQVFYQCVSNGAVENTKAECLRVGRQLVAMRRDATIPYDRIVDRTRGKHIRPSWDGLADILTATAAQYRRDYFRDARVVPMIACEKQALEGIFEDAVDEYGAPLYVIRGFNSESFEFEWAQDIKRHNAEGQDVAIYYFGDFDPSGLCIEANSRRKLEGFGARFDWKRAGLLWEDFERFDLVNIPVKRTDSRAKSYLSQFGDRAAELDALHPDELRRRIAECIAQHVDPDRWEAQLAGDAAGREGLASLAGNLPKALAAVR